MAKLTAKLAYVASQQLVKVELSKAVCMESELPPEDLFKRAIAKFESVKKSGDIILYQTFAPCVEQVWTAIRNDETLDPHKIIKVNLGAGLPHLEGLKISKSSQPKALIDLTLPNNPVELARWNAGWIEMAIKIELNNLGEEGLPNMGQVKGAIMRAITGQLVDGLPISPAPEVLSEEEIEVKPYSLVANKGRKEIVLIVRDLSAVIDKLNVSGVVELASKSSKRLELQTGDHYKILEKEIISSLEDLIESPAVLGLGLPRAILCAVDADVAAPEKPKSPIELLVSDDKMSATISNFSMSLYDDLDIQMTKNWFAQQLRKQGLPKSSFLPYLQDLVDAAKRQEDLTGSVVAQGEASIRGDGPYLFDYLKDGESDAIDFDNDVLDLRGLQQRTLAETGALVAEIRYMEEAQEGIDIYGKILYPEIPDDFDVQVGEGIEQRDGGKFYASSDGVVKIEGTAISLSKILIHNGDVNLRSGNIMFDGPVEVRGSIDSGAMVEASGDLTVLGNIRSAVVKSGGSITVKGGIVTSAQGRLEAKDDIRAEFIENSKIHCEGSLYAKKAIINTTAIVGGSIEVSSKTDGILAGGYLTCRHNIRTESLGFKRGAVTKLKVGVDWRIERAVFIRNSRLEKIVEVQQRDRLEMRELAGKRKAQLTRKHVERKTELMERVKKARSIVDKLTSQLEKFRAKLSFNMDSVVFISGSLSSNVELNIGGVHVNIPHDLAGIGVSAKRRRGSHILPYDEAERFSLKSMDNAG